MIPVVYYHSIAPKKNKTWFRNFLTVESVYFEQHLKVFKDQGYRSVHLDEFFDLVSYKPEIKDKLVVFTFDDGYLDNYVFAYPMLKKYGFCGTVFVNTDYIDRKEKTLRKTLFDYWDGKCAMEELPDLGFLNPDEMRLLEDSGTLRMESHTKTHDMHYVSDKIIGFHHPGGECLYPIGNRFPSEKPYYPGNSSFERLIPYGMPFFEEKSSVIAQRVYINPDLENEIVSGLKTFDWNSNYDYNLIYNLVSHIYLKYKSANNIVLSTESLEEYEKRVFDELYTSKAILEEELSRKVNFLCWPHGDNNETSNRIAESVGYKAATLGKGKTHNQKLMRFDRFGLDSVRNSLFLTRLHTKYKTGELRGEFPWSALAKTYRASRRIF